VRTVEELKMAESRKKQRVVIVGAGFAASTPPGNYPG